MLRQRGTATLLAIRGTERRKSNGGLTRRVDDIRIHDNSLGRRVVKVGQRHQERLAAVASAPSSAKMVLPPDRSRLYIVLSDFSSCSTTGPQRVSPGDPAEVGTAAVLLGLCPGDGLLRRGVLQPSVVLGDIDLRERCLSPGSVEPRTKGSSVM